MENRKHEDMKLQSLQEWERLFEKGGAFQIVSVKLLFE